MRAPLLQIPADESMDAGTPGPTRRLAAFAAKLSWNDLEPQLVTKIKLHILDTIGCGLFGATRPWSGILREVVKLSDSGDRCVFWGTSLRGSGLAAALVNGTAAHGYELDDIHVRGVMHPGPPSVSAALAAATYSDRPISGRDILVAIAAGYEVGVRVAACMGVPHLLKGWHPTGTSGVFSAAAAAGRTLRLDEDTMLHALGTAGPHASGLIAAQYGGMAKRLYVGHAAQSGVLAVQLAQAGFKGIRDVLEAPFGGYVRTFDGRGDPHEIVEGLGERFELMNTGLKRYPTAGAIHAGVDALEQIQNEHHVSPDEVESITAYVSHSTFEHCGWRYAPNGATGAQMNLSFALASRLVRGELFVTEFEEQNIAAPEVLSALEKVRVVNAEDIDALGESSRYSTRVVVRTHQGSSYTATVHHPKGTVANPFTAEEVEDKFRRLAASVLPPHQIEAIINTVRRLEAVEDISCLQQDLAAHR